MKKFTYTLGLVISPMDSDELLISSLNSIINQTQMPDEMIILKNGQLNIFKNKIIDMLDSHLNCRIKKIENSITLDFSKALNTILANSSCDYLIRQDPDDISFHNRIEVIRKEIDSNEFDFFHSSTLELNRNTNRVTLKHSFNKINDIKRNLIFFNPILHSSVTISTKLLKKYNGYEYANLAEDYLLWLKIFTNLIKVGYSDLPLVLFDSTNKLIKRSSKKILRTEFKLFISKLKFKYNPMLSFIAFIFRIGYLISPILIKKLLNYKEKQIQDTTFIVNIINSNSSPLSKKEIINKVNIDVIIPNYNRVEELNRAIESVINQTLTNSVVIYVIDDHSDISIKIDNNLKNKYPIMELKTDYQSGGPAAPRNIGLKASDSDLVAFLDSDDVWEPNHLETALKYAPFGKMYAQSVKGKTVNRFSTNSLINKNLIITSSVVIPKQMIKKIGMFQSKPSNNLIYEDYSYWLKISCLFNIFLNGDKTVNYSKVKEGSYSTKIVSDFICLRNTFKDYFHFLKINNIKFPISSIILLNLRYVKSYIGYLLNLFKK